MISVVLTTNVAVQVVCRRQDPAVTPPTSEAPPFPVGVEYAEPCTRQIAQGYDFVELVIDLSKLKGPVKLGASRVSQISAEARYWQRFRH